MPKLNYLRTHLSERNPHGTIDLDILPSFGEPEVGQVLGVGKNEKEEIFVQWQAPAIGQTMDLTGYLSSPISLYGTSYADIPGLSFDVEANGIYLFEFFLALSTDGFDFRLQLTGPASINNMKALGFSSSTTWTPAVITAFSSSLVLAYTLDPGFAVIHGVLNNGPNAGTVQLQASSY